MRKALETLGFSKIKDMVKRIYLIQVLKAAIERNEFDKFSLMKKYGLNKEDIEYLWSIFPEIKMGKRITSRQVLGYMNELNRKLNMMKSKMLGESELWIFPKWRELIGAVYMGMFEGRPIKEIVWSVVVLIIPSTKEIFRYRLLSGEECVGIFGLGAYICEFIPERAREPITFSLPLHGVLIEMPLYRRAIESKKVLIVPKYADYMREHLIRVPLGDLITSKFASRFFVTILRKNARQILWFLKTIKKYSMADVELDNVNILSAWRGAFNKILVTKSKAGKLSVDMIKGVPGIVGYEGVLDKIKELPMMYDFEVFISKQQTLWLQFAIAGYDFLEKFTGMT